MAAGKVLLSPFGGTGAPLSGGTTESKLKVALNRGEAGFQKLLTSLDLLGTAVAAPPQARLCNCPAQLCWWSALVEPCCPTLLL